MKNIIVWLNLIFFFSFSTSPFVSALNSPEKSMIESVESSDFLIARPSRGGGGRGSRGGGSRSRGNRGGNRSGGNRSRNVNNRNNSNRRGSGFNRSNVGGNGSNRIQRPEGSRNNSRNKPVRNNNGNINLNRDRGGSNRINNDNLNKPGNIIELPKGGDRNNIQNRQNNHNRQDLNLNRDRDYSNRVNRNRNGNRNNIGNNNNININRNRNVVVNPRGRGGVAWGWNRGVAWYPRYNYWGGGFWGAFAIGAVTGGIIGAATSNNENNTYIENNYYIIEKDTPGYTLLSDYNLIQTQCIESNNIVIINGPENSQICALPNDIVPAGFYSIDMDTLTLVGESY